MTNAKTFEDLDVWRKAHQLVLEIYKTTKTFPKEELFVLTSQIRRAAISIPSNIAEGFGRRSQKDKIHFYNIAETSANEARYQLRLAQDLSYSTTNDLQDAAQEIQRMLKGLINSIEAR